MNAYTVSVHVCRTWQDRTEIRDDFAAILEGLGKHTVEQTGIRELDTSLHVFLRDKAGTIVGGTAGEIFGSWIYISLLWVEKSLRGKGYGTQLMQTMERGAMNLDCHNAHLCTFSFEAKPFYEKLGYQVFATLENYPPGHRKFFLKKSLK